MSRSVQARPGDVVRHLAATAKQMTDSPGILRLELSDMTERYHARQQEPTSYAPVACHSLHHKGAAVTLIGVVAFNVRQGAAQMG